MLKKYVFTNWLLESFNRDGKGEKQALAKLRLVETILQGK